MFKEYIETTERIESNLRVQENRNGSILEQILRFFKQFFKSLIFSVLYDYTWISNMKKINRILCTGIYILYYLKTKFCSNILKYWYGKTLIIIYNQENLNSKKSVKLLCRHLGEKGGVESIEIGGLPFWSCEVIRFLRIFHIYEVINLR